MRGCGEMLEEAGGKRGMKEEGEEGREEGGGVVHQLPAVYWAFLSHT